MKIIAAIVLKIVVVSGSYTYHLAEKHTTQKEAAKACASHQEGSLARITSKESQLAISEELRGKKVEKNMWIEAYGSWRQEKEQWVHPEDNIEMEGCGSLAGGKFEVEDCMIQLPYICQMRDEAHEDSE